MYAPALEVLVVELGYKLANRLQDLTPLQRAYLLEVWKKNHPGR